MNTDYILKIVEDFDFNSIKPNNVNIGEIIVCQKDMKEFMFNCRMRAFNYKFFEAFCGYNHDFLNADLNKCLLTVGYADGTKVFDMHFYPDKHVDLDFYVVFIFNTKVHEYLRQAYLNNEKYDIKIDNIKTPYVSSNSSPVALLDMDDVNCIPNIYTNKYHITQTIFASYDILEAFYDKMTNMNPGIKLYISDRQAKHSMFCHRGNPKFPEYRKLFKKNFEIISEGSAKYIRKK